MFSPSFSNVLLCVCVCFTVVKIASLQQSSISSEQTEKQIHAIADDIRSKRFALAQEKITKLKDNNKIAHIIHDAYQNEEDSFAVILDFTKALTRVDLAFYALKALRNEMVANGHLDPMKMIPLAREFGENVVFQKNNDEIIKAEAEKIIKDIRADVKSTATEILSKAMVSGNYYLNSKTEILAEEIYNFFEDLHLSDEIMREMVNRTYLLVRPLEIVEIIMRSSKFIPQKVSVFLEVFKKLEEDKDLDNVAILEIAYCIKQLKDQKEYEKLVPNRKHDVNVMIDKLPTCARNLYFAPEFCIWNRSKLEYLYADSLKSYSSDGRSVYTSPPEAVEIGEGSWVGEKFFDDFLIQSQSFTKEYLDVSRIGQRLGHYAQTNEKNEYYENMVWKIELSGEYCYIKNQVVDEYLFVSNQMHSARERYVFSASPGPAIDPINFQWQIRDCS